MILVIETYRRGFIEAFENFRKLRSGKATLFYSNLGWGDEEASTLAEALLFAQAHCCIEHGPLMVSCFDGNRITQDGRGRLQETVDGRTFVLDMKGMPRTR